MGGRLVIPERNKAGLTLPRVSHARRVIGQTFVKPGTAFRPRMVQVVAHLDRQQNYFFGQEEFWMPLVAFSGPPVLDSSVFSLAFA